MTQGYESSNTVDMSSESLPTSPEVSARLEYEFTVLEVSAGLVTGHGGRTVAGLVDC